MSARYLKDLRIRRNIFSATFGKERAVNVSQQVVDNWITALPKLAPQRTTTAACGVFCSALLLIANTSCRSQSPSRASRVSSAPSRGFSLWTNARDSFPHVMTILPAVTLEMLIWASATQDLWLHPWKLVSIRRLCPSAERCMASMRAGARFWSATGTPHGEFLPLLSRRSTF
jgi:hypothetical protein